MLEYSNTLRAISTTTSDQNYAASLMWARRTSCIMAPTPEGCTRYPKRKRQTQDIVSTCNFFPGMGRYRRWDERNFPINTPELKIGTMAHQGVGNRQGTVRCALHLAPKKGVCGVTCGATWKTCAVLYYQRTPRRGNKAIKG